MKPPFVKSDFTEFNLFRSNDGASGSSCEERRASDCHVGLDQSESLYAESVEVHGGSESSCEARHRRDCHGEHSRCVLSYEERTLAATD